MVCRLAPANSFAVSSAPTPLHNSRLVIPPSPKARYPCAGFPDSSVARGLRCQRLSECDGQSRAPARTPARTLRALQISALIHRRIPDRYRLFHRPGNRTAQSLTPLRRIPIAYNSGTIPAWRDDRAFPPAAARSAPRFFCVSSNTKDTNCTSGCSR